MSLPWQLEECNRFVDAIASGNSKLFSELLQSSQEIRAVDMISLHYACSYSELEILGMLLQDDRFDINARNCRSATPLHIASQNGAVEAVKMLCKANCDLNATNEWGESALHVAVQSAQSNCIIVLLEAGCKTDLVDKWGQTPCEVIGICIFALESCGLSPSKLPFFLFLYFSSLTYSFFVLLRIRSRLRMDYQILASGSSLL